MPDPIQLPDPSQYLIKPKRGVDRLTGFAGERGLTVTSTTGGRHNPGSKHYQGEAVDVRTKDQSPDYINEVMRQAQALGYRVRDERTRPAGQREWGGPHLHMENTPQTAALDRLPDPSKYLKTPPAAPMSEEQRVAEQNAALKAKAPKPAPEGSGAFLRGFDKLRGNAFEKLASDSLANVEAENTRGQLATQQAIQRQRGTVDITKPQRSATMDRRLQENKPVVPRLTAQAIQNNVRQPDVFGIEGRSEGPRTKPPVDRLARQRQQMEARDRQPYMEAAQNGILAPYLQEFESYGWNTKPIVDNVAGALQSADRIINQPIDVQETARRAGAALQKLPGDIIQGAANLSDALGDSGLRVIDNAPRLSEPVRTRVQQANRQIEAEMGVNPDAPSSLATVATEGAISSLPYLATGAVGAGMRGVAAMGALQNTGQTYEDVRARGGAPDIALQTAVRSAPIGALEGLMGTEAALAKAGVSPGLVRQFGAALRAAPPDLAQEVTSQVLNNLNQDRPVLEGTVEAAIGSLATSGALGGGAVLGRSAQVMRDRSAVRAANMQEAARLQQEAAQQQQELAEGEEILRQAGEQRRAAQQPAQAQPQPQAQAGRTTTAPVATAQAPVDSEIASFLDAIAAENGLTPRTQGKAASNKVSTEARYQEASQVAEDTRAAFEQAQAGADKEAFATTKAAHLEALRAKKSAAVDLREKTALASEIARVEKAKGGTGKAAASTPVTAPPAAPDALTPGQVRQVQAKTGLSYQEIMALPAADMRALLAQPATPVQARSLTDIRNDARLRDAGLSPEEIQALTPQEKAQLIPPRPTNQNPPPNPGRDTAPRPTNPNSIGAKLEAMRQAKAQAQTPQPAAPAQPSVASRPGSPSAPQSSTAVPVRATTTAVATAAPTGTAAATRVNRPLNIPERARLIRELGYSAEDLRTKTPDEWREVSRQGTKKPLPSIAPQNVQRGDFFTHSAVNKGEPVRVVARDEKGIKIEFPNGTQKRIPSDSFVLQEGTFTRPATTARPVSPVAQPVRGATVPAQTPQTVSTNPSQNVVKSGNGNDQGTVKSASSETASPRNAGDGTAGNLRPLGGAVVQASADALPREASTGQIVDERAGNQKPVSNSGSSVVSATQAPAPASAEPTTARTTEGVNVRPDAQEPVSRESDIYRTKEGRVSEAQLAAIDARAEKRASTETGEHGKISAWARKSFETPQGRTTALALQPELRRYLGLPAIPQNADSATLNKAAQHTMDALAEKMGKGRSSEIDHDAHVDFLAQNGPRLSPAVVESYAKTLAAYKAQQAFEDGTAELPEVQQAIKEVNDAKAQNTRQSKQTIRAKFEAIAQAYGLPKVAGTRFADKYFGLKAAQRSVSVDAGRDVQGSSEPQDARVNSEVAPQPATNESGTADRASDAQRREPQPEPPTVEQAGEQVDLPSASPFTEPPSIESLSHMLPRRSLRSLSVDERAQLAAAQSNPDIPVPAFPVKGKPSSMALVEGNEVFGGQSIVRYGAQGEPIGILHFDVDAQGRPDVAVVAVDPKYRRQGIASSLYDFAYNNGIDLSTAEGKGGYTEEGKALKRGREAKADRASDAQRREPQPEPPTVEQAGEQVNEAINRSASAISGQPATVGDFLYNGSTAEGGILKPRGAARNYNELGSWFTSSKEAADELYSKQGTKDLTIRSYAKPQGNLLEAPHQDFARLFGSNIPLVEQHLGKRAAAILRERLPDSVRRTELHRELNENGDFFKVGRSLKQAEMLGKELRQLDAADRVALSAMNNPAYVQAWQKMMQDAGYDGVVWRKSQIDAPRSVKEHDVYLIFHNQELKPISDAAPTQPAPEQPATPDTVPPDKLEIGQPVRIPQGEGTYGGTNPRDPGSHYVDMPDGERIAVKREQISSIGPTKSLGSGLNPFEEARQIAGGVKKIAKAITSPREKSKTLVAFPTDFTMTKWTEEMKTASGKRKHDDKSRTHIKDLIREAYTAYKDDDFGRFLAVEKDLQDVLRSRSMNVVSAANTLTRAASLSGEVSYIGRQGGIPAVTDTRAWARSVKSLFTKGTGFTKESYFNNVARLLSDPAYGAAKEAGVDFALEHEFAANARVLRREENALSGLGERLGRTIGLTQLEQVNKAFIDNLRLQMFKDRAAAMNATGKWADLSPRQQQRMKEMAKEINRFSGRANINEKAQEAVDAAGFLATSARFTISRFQSVDPTKIARAYIAGKRNGDYAAANRMLRDYAKIAAFPLMIGMGLSAMGWEIGSDPDDENFLKAKKGNRHVDILPGGVTSAVKITARLAKRAIEMGKAGKDEEARMAALEKAGDQSVKFLRYKLAPLPSLVVDQVIDRTEMTDKATGRAVSYGKNAIGEPKTFNQSLWDRLHPIAWDNIGENLQKEGAVSLLATWWELIGHNASIYEARGQRMEGAETQKGFIQRETRLENGKLSQEPIADYQQRVEVGTRLLSRYRAMLDASDLYKNASPEQQARMRERLEDRVRRATKQETPNEANLTPADIAKDLRGGDKRNATQDRRLKPFYR